MRYHPPKNTSEINLTEKETSYAGDLTLHPLAALQRYKYEIEPKEGVIDKNYMARNKDIITAINKFMPLGNYNKVSTIKLIGRRFSNIIGEKDAGLRENAEETALHILKDIAMSRGAGGFAAKLEVTEHKIWQDESRQNEKRGLFGGFLRERDKNINQAEMVVKK